MGMGYQNVQINDDELFKSVVFGMTTEFNTKEEYINYMEYERVHGGWTEDYPEQFKTVKDTRKLAVDYLLKYNGKYYLVGNDEELSKIVNRI